jgi:signal transduction histidine kinase
MTVAPPISAPSTPLRARAKAAPTTVAALPLARLLVDARLAAVVLTLIVVTAEEGPAAITAGLAVAAVLSFELLRRWEDLAPRLARHPALLGLDSLLGLVLLYGTGANGTFFVYTLGSAALAALLLRRAGALLIVALHVLGYLLALGATVAPDERLSFQSLVGLPLLYLLAALGARAVLQLLLDQGRAGERLRASAAETIAAEERARLAREMHDSLAKTLHGIALSAEGVRNWVQRSPEVAAARASDLARAAELASTEARTLIGNLRADSGDRPLDELLCQTVNDWSTDTGVRAELSVERLSLDATARYELLCVLREALRNVERHAGASSVTVTLTDEGDHARLDVRDDGEGFTTDASQAAAWQRSGHYGLVGMSERAERAGGRLEVRSAPGAGTTVSMVVPTGEVQPRMEPLR